MGLLNKALVKGLPEELGADNENKWSQISRYRGWDMNPVPPTYGGGV